MLLAIDTSTAIASVALYDGVMGGECTWLARQDHTRQLMPQIVNLLHTHNLLPHDLSGVGVSLGPGSYNGLRVGLATAKALALTLHLPIVGVNTLAVSAYAHNGVGLPVRPVLDAGRGQASTALYAWEGESWTERESPQLVDPPELVRLVREPTLLVGEWRSDWLPPLLEACGDLVRLPSAASNFRRAGFLAELAWRRLQAGQVDDVAMLQPLYLRKPAITVSRRECG